MSRHDAVALAAGHFDDGSFLAVLKDAVGRPTECQAPGQVPALTAYLTDFIEPLIARLGFTSRIVDNPDGIHGPFLIAERHEGDDLPTVLMYGHGDTVRNYPEQWRTGLDPLRIVVEGERWYGRGTADNKGQHVINLGALEAVMRARGGTLGFNAKLLIETGEESGSPGLRDVCRAEGAALAADVLIASDGPRVNAERPTVFLGSRGGYNFELVVDLREGGHHSGNWGGLLRNPGTVLASAIASMVDGRGRILVDALRPPPIPEGVRAALGDITVGGDPNAPKIDADWGEPGLSPAERVFGWNALEVLAFKCGDPEGPLNAVPPSAKATLQLRFVVGTDWQGLLPAIRAHLDANGFPMVEVRACRAEMFRATRLPVEDPWVGWALASIEATTAKRPALLPNLGGSLPNDAFSEILGLPTLWVPHSYPACSQHAPDEHLLGPSTREALELMAGLFWDLGETGPAVVARRASRND
ncbi:M20 family metallopeptidase [Methylobacterium dankookense]|uniref:Acetylornithine deacetylase n=1 Tax=Methylobacterium dankookense TaxID=560405 RepID=A0A564FWQ1_9HYPH|nr:M20 family metallopeptidase [Methylobacterium dankookense]GJD54731.1 Acetylornithine deacetylase [Methylobacterium dankookense]VUF12599.1 Acetylornithine deacetylase [Methylobacterium dankookense]